MTRSAPRSRDWRPALAWGVIALAVAAVYAPVRGYPFVVYDDLALVVENPVVRDGLTREGMARAFTESIVGNYVPLTWISHMLDVELFGMDAGGHHVVNALLHTLASLLLFEALRRLSGDLLPSAFVALVFAIHPAHVESVAWVAERRDTLAALWFMLALWLHAGAAREGPRRAWQRGALIVAAALGLLAKPMLVTLPFVLLLLDLWPLGRAAEGWRRLVGEKWPLLALCAAAAAATLASQSGAGAVASLSQVPAEARITNALVSAVAYLGKTLVPVGLAVFYPYDLAIPVWKAAAAAGLLGAAAAFAWRQRHRRPYLAVGLAWYAITLLPVIGLVQVGSQGMADRYTYLPMIGPAIAVAWGGAELWAARPRLRRLLSVLGIAWLLACLVLARLQLETWRDSVSLFEHARAVVGDDPVVLVNLGEAYDEAGEAERAIAHYRAGLGGFPHARRARTRLGILLAEQGQREAAAAQLREAIRRHPEETGGRLALARLALRTGELDEAERWLSGERALDPQAAPVRFHEGELAAMRGQHEEAVAGFAEALALDPALDPAPVLDAQPAVAEALAEALRAAGREDEARRWAKRALALARLAGDEERAARLRGWDPPPVTPGDPD